MTYQIVIAQAVVALAVSAMLLAFGSDEASSALLAGAVSVAPSGLFAWQTERTRTPGRLVAFGVVRFVLTLVLLGFAVALLKPAPLGFFGTLAVAQLTYVVGPLMNRGAAGSVGRGAR